jgi:hypothetical protein
MNESKSFHQLVSANTQIHEPQVRLMNRDARPMVQTQVVGLHDSPVNPVFSERFGAHRYFRRATVCQFCGCQILKIHLGSTANGETKIKDNRQRGAPGCTLHPLICDRMSG